MGILVWWFRLLVFFSSTLYYTLEHDIETIDHWLLSVLLKVLLYRIGVGLDSMLPLLLLFGQKTNKKHVFIISNFFFIFKIKYFNSIQEWQMHVEKCFENKHITTNSQSNWGLVIILPRIDFHCTTPPFCFFHCRQGTIRQDKINKINLGDWPTNHQQHMLQVKSSLESSLIHSDRSPPKMFSLATTVSQSAPSKRANSHSPKCQKLLNEHWVLKVLFYPSLLNGKINFLTLLTRKRIRTEHSTGCL